LILKAFVLGALTFLAAVAAVALLAVPKQTGDEITTTDGPFVVRQQR
jgi:hypothetical protein